MTENHSSSDAEKWQQLRAEISKWGEELGFQQIGITDTDVSNERERLDQWLEKGYHGSMNWMEDRRELRLNPGELQPGALRVISARMDYLHEGTDLVNVLKSPNQAYISRYALGRDYHKLIRKRLAQLAERIEEFCQKHDLFDALSQRAFVDSAPILERPLAAKAGLGWVGKHTLILHPEAGSWFFLGEILTNLPIPCDEKTQENQCGSCQACLQVCPTDAFPKPYELDARRCISYLTIEHDGSIDEEFREVMGNRVYGCDDCQAICPWNKYAQFTSENDFSPRHNLSNEELLTLFEWDETTFLDKTAGSPIRRIGYQKWLRNLSVGLGNAPASPEIIQALNQRLQEPWDDWLIEHFQWALARQSQPPKRRLRKLPRKGN